MNCICVNKDFTYATDGHIAVRHVTSELFPEEFISSLSNDTILIPAQVIHVIRKRRTFRVSLTDDKTQIRIHQENGITVLCDLLCDVKYPDVGSLIPAKKDCLPIDNISFNVEYLGHLIKGIGCSHPTIKMYFYGPTKAILVESEYGYRSAVGIIMPCDFNN
jgi:hypothetical protein